MDVRAMRNLRSNFLFVTPLLFLAAGCANSPSIDELQEVFGPKQVRFQQRAVTVDLNHDGHPERLVLLANQLRGLRLPQDIAGLRRGAVVDGFAVFDGRHPDVLVFYQYWDYDGLALRLDKVEGNEVLVSDGGRDHIQHNWGWWDYAEAWPPAGWEARHRAYDTSQDRWGTWQASQRVAVLVGK